MKKILWQQKILFSKSDFHKPDPASVGVYDQLKSYLFTVGTECASERDLYFLAHFCNFSI